MNFTTTTEKVILIIILYLSRSSFKYNNILVNLKLILYIEEWGKDVALLNEISLLGTIIGPITYYWL
jgi:hypothetical protein